MVFGISLFFPLLLLVAMLIFGPAVKYLALQIRQRINARKEFYHFFQFYPEDKGKFANLKVRKILGNLAANIYFADQYILASLSEPTPKAQRDFYQKLRDDAQMLFDRAVKLAYKFGFSESKHLDYRSLVATETLREEVRPLSTAKTV